MRERRREWRGMRLQNHCNKPCNVVIAKESPSTHCDVWVVFDNQVGNYHSAL